MYVCMYVCMYVFMYVLCVCMYECMYGWMDGCVRVCVYVCTYVFMYAFISCVHVRMYVRTYAFMNGCLPHSVVALSTVLELQRALQHMVTERAKIGREDWEDTLNPRIPNARHPLSQGHMGC